MYISVYLCDMFVNPSHVIETAFRRTGYQGKILRAVELRKNHWSIMVSADEEIALDIIPMELKLGGVHLIKECCFSFNQRLPFLMADE